MIRMTGLVSGLDTDAIVKELMSAQSSKKTKIENNVTKTEWKQEKWKDLNTKIYSFYTGALSKARLQGNFNTKKASSTNEGKVSVSASGSAVEGNHKIQVKQVASSQYFTSAKIENYIDSDGKEQSISNSSRLVDLGIKEGSVITIETGGKSKDITIGETTTIANFIYECKNAGISANFDGDQKRIFLSSNKSGTENAFSITSTDNALSYLGISEMYANDRGDGTIVYTDEYGNDLEEALPEGAAFVKAANSIISYNGAELTSSSTSITANGLNITVKGVTEKDEYIDIAVTKDAQAVYDMVKDFVKQYNELLKEMNENYNAASAKDYDVLTDEQKEAMTDDQIEKWENKIKDSLLRRDSTLDGILSVMKNSLAGSVKVNDMNYSLASFGIHTADYTEKGILHIDGDSDDAKTSGETDKLMAAIEKDPDAVAQVISTLAQKLYTGLTDKMKKTSLSSALTFYNDKQIQNELDSYKKRIKTMEDRLDDMEDRYYKQFTSLEMAMSSYNSMGSLFGTNTAQ